VTTNDPNRGRLARVRTCPGILMIIAYQGMVPVQMLRESLDRVSQRNHDVLWIVAIGDLEQHHLSGVAFHQGPDA
jgi:hypothetical protein